MFVSTPIGSNPLDMKLTVISSAGSAWEVEVLPEFTIDKLKLMALGHFFNPVDLTKSSDYYKLVLVSGGRALSGECSIRDENLVENDELLLLKRNAAPIPSSEKPEEKELKSRGPTAALIEQATATVEPINADRHVDEYPTVVDFHTELRKILVSLVEGSEKLLRHHPDIKKIFKDLPNKLNKVEKDEIDQNALKQLTDMGFEESRAIQALKQNKMSPVAAMEWLLTRSSETDLGVQECTNTSSISTKPHSVTDVQAPSSSSSSSTPGNPDVSQVSQSRRGIVAAMLECYQEYKRKDFKPNRKALNNLKEMGFGENEILDALRIHNNSQDAACDWLLGDRKPTPGDLQCGLDPEGPIYKAILSNAVVQLGLCTPKTLLALLQMLENPGSAARWLGDPDTAPILSQIFRIYHAEKHSVHLIVPFTQ